MNMQDVARELCEGNSGAISVCRQIMETDKPKGTLRVMQLHKLRGKLIWTAYELCDKDVHKLVKRLVEQDPYLFRGVNEQREKEGCDERCGL